jgi:glycosyltransferase involved in cell wall biosynthesis
MNGPIMSSPAAEFPEVEAATIARRLSFRLGCQTVALVGCVRPELLTSLSDLSLAGFDVPARCSYAAALVPGGRWLGVDDAAAALAALPTPFAILSPAAIDALDDVAIAACLAAVPAALVHDIDGVAGRGPAALGDLVARVRARGLHVLHAELIAPSVGGTGRRVVPALLISDGHDERAAYLVGAGFHGLRLDPDADGSGQADRPARVCIVSYEVVGPSRNGGIGTANTSLAQVLAAAGQDVTLIYSGAPTGAREREHWRRHFDQGAVRYLELSEAGVDSVDSPFVNIRRAWAAFELVRKLDEERPFDVIHGPECQGHLMFIAHAKCHGIAFQAAQIVAGVHSPTRWCTEANRQPLLWPSQLADEYMERAAVEASDVVVSPSAYMLTYLRARGWRLPERSFVAPYVRSEAIRRLTTSPAAPARPAAPPDEIVFFGRLETRKGLQTFCDALDLLVGEEAANALSVTFMGLATALDGASSDAYIARRAGGWPWPVRIETSLSQPEAVDYLRRRPCLAVMPSLVDNSPNTVSEAIALGIPFVASRSGGTSELISADDLDRCSFDGWSEDDGLLEPVPAGVAPRRFDAAPLRRAILRALHEPAAAVAPAVAPKLNEAVHIAWHEALAGGRPRSPAPALPALSVIRVSRRPEAGDDVSGPRGGLTISLREDAAPTQDRRAAHEWTVGAGDPGLTVAGAQQLAAQRAAGQVLLFIGPDVDPEPQIDAAVRLAAARSAADVLLYGIGQASERTGRDGRGPGRVQLPVGGPAVLALAFSIFGEGGFAIRADALRRLGGFSSTDRSENPAFGLLTRAALSGLRIEVIPAVLATASGADPDAFGRRSPWHVDDAQRVELLRPFVQLGGALGDLAALHRMMHESPGVLTTSGDESFREGLRRLLARERARREARRAVHHVRARAGS